MTVLAMSPAALSTLRLRLVVALGLVIALPFVLVYTVIFLGNTVGLALLEWVHDRPYHGQLYVDPVLLTTAVVGALMVQYWVGPRAVCRSVGARTVSSDAYPAAHAALTRVAAQADAPKPALAVTETGAPNAFAVAGGNSIRQRDDSGGTIVVTTGLLETLTDDELEAVLAHELAHLENRDASLMTVAWLVPTITYYLAVVAFYVIYGSVRLLGSGSGLSTRRSGDTRSFAVVFLVAMVCAVLTLAISVLFWAGSVLLHRVLSREREYVADQAAAAITGSPAALASALESLDETISEVPDSDLRTLDGGTEALCLVPLDSQAFDTQSLISMDIFPATHPPTAERIDRLRALARDQRGEQR
ncbi:M48 family metalloprotease [Natronolimnobius sp. AArcel1]|uniref:M48 family metalloprotease n=1 Tax=Natronolimnobius sp. AArcel1 TaxID=1679093 RepID=UPI0013EDE906|nr:M48 family metalloprotease [Natronolimnobius sp. AArcel1]NGM68311.1 M48 family metalloprotease [Natronolimnobius sp. AArcel1]